MTENAPASVARGFLFADLRGYSAWVERHGDQAAALLLREYRGLVRQAVGEFDGSEIKTEGDSFYVVFGSPSAAVNCGLRILELAAESQAAAGGPIPVGIGVHAGETVATDEGYVGSVVNVAARVCAQAGAGELLVTDAVRSMTRTYLGVTFSPRGRKRLKGIPEPIALYQVTPVGVAVGASRWRPLTRRWPIGAAAVGIALVVLASAFIGGALIRGTAGGPEGIPTAPASSAVGEAAESAAPSASAETEFPTADESRLIELVDEADRRHCERANYEVRPVMAYDFPQGNRTVTMRAQTRAGIICDLGGFTGPDELWLWQIVEARDQEGDPAAAAIAALAGRIGAAPGSCRETRPTFEAWSFGGISGKLLCYETDEGDAALVWVYDNDEERRLFARAVRDDRDMDALLDWWEDVGRFAAP